MNKSAKVDEYLETLDNPLLEEIKDVEQKKDKLITVVKAWVNLMDNLITIHCLVLACLLISCTNKGNETFNQQLIRVDTESHIKQMLDDYRKAWLVNDSAKVMSYISENAVFYRPSADEKALNGKDQITDFWFPKSSSNISYPVFEYELTYRSIEVDSNLAIVEGISLLSWYRLENEVASDTASAITEFITVLKKENNEWKLYKQMYNSKSTNYLTK